MNYLLHYTTSSKKIMEQKKKTPNEFPVVRSSMLRVKPCRNRRYGLGSFMSLVLFENFEKRLRFSFGNASGTLSKRLIKCFFLMRRQCPIINFHGGLPSHD
jgi:hypothetical protein